jgi:hypothetical protein
VKVHPFASAALAADHCARATNPRSKSAREHIFARTMDTVMVTLYVAERERRHR